MTGRSLAVLIRCLIVMLSPLLGSVTLAAAQQDSTANVRRYGAVGDGVADDTNAILKSVDAVNAAGGGTVFFPAGTYNVDSALLKAASNHSLTIKASNVTVAGEGPRSKIQLKGSSECGFLLARNVDNLYVRDLYFVGNGKGQPSSVLGSFVWYDNVGATANRSGIWVDRCTVEDCNSGEWIDVHCYAGSYGIKDIRIRDCRFISHPGNIPLTGTNGVPACNIHIVGPKAPATNCVEDILISGNISEATYIKSFLALMYRGVRNATVCHNEVHNAGVDKATSRVGSYAFNYYGGASYVNSYSNKILNPWTCGFYAVSGDHLIFSDNVISGQVDKDDGTLCTGAYAFGNCRDTLIQGGEVANCGIGVQVQPLTWNAGIVVTGVRIRNSGVCSLVVRESAIWRHAGGVTVRGCRIEDGDLRIQRGSSAARLGNLTIENNVIERGQIYLTKDVFDTVIANNQIFATNRKAGIFCNGGEGLQICGNRIAGPGAAVVSSYGIQFNKPVQNPSLISGNVISAFQHGLGTARVSASLRDNIFQGVGDRVANTANFDLGLDPPATISDTMVAYWDRGQYVENLRGNTAGAPPAWLVTGPPYGRSCTCAATASGSMQKGTRLITNVSSPVNYVPGCTVILANAAQGPSPLRAQIEAWLVSYSALRGRFQDGEEVEGRTSNALADIGTDNGANQMTLVRVRRQAGVFTPGETIVGHRSGAQAVVGGFALQVADTCENTVSNAVLEIAGPTWVDLEAPSN